MPVQPDFQAVFINQVLKGVDGSFSALRQQITKLLFSITVLINKIGF